jgi:hypothetical protein
LIAGHKKGLEKPTGGTRKVDQHATLHEPVTA